MKQLKKNGEKKPATYAHVSWSPDDVLVLRPNMTLEQAEEWLENNEKHLASRLVELGWDVMEDLLKFDE